MNYREEAGQPKPFSWRSAKQRKEKERKGCEVGSLGVHANFLVIRLILAARKENSKALELLCGQLNERWSH